ncbi:MAG: asparaginase [Planctomycetes bacterium]|nr:asparaginase [Planctomycetota bacterium]
MSAPNPVLVRSDRGGLPEICHRGVVVAWRGAASLFSRGDAQEPCFLRSTAKYFQAVSALRCGLLQRHALQTDELALMCASHGGEPRHVEVAARLLGRGGLNAAHLRCGSHWPMNARAAQALSAVSAKPTALHNNCSGKHAGMLLASQLQGFDLESYLSPEHPHQLAIVALMREYSGAQSIGVALDGCSAPTFSMPVEAAARAFARFAVESIEHGSNAHTLAQAVAAQPGMLAGDGRFCTGIATATGGRVQAKTGADGFFGAFCRATGTGIALHIDDGATSASERVMTATLVHLGLLRSEEVAALNPWCDARRLNRLGSTVGQTVVDLG